VAFLHPDNFADATFDVEEPCEEPCDEYVRAIRGGGRGDVTKTQLLWKHELQREQMSRRLIIITAIFAFFAVRGVSLADEVSKAADASETAPKPTGLQAIDWAIIVLYAAGTIGLGLYFSRKQKSTGEYFVGSGNMGSFFIGVSLFATLLSTISYLSMPGEAAGKGPVAMIGMLAYPLIYLVVGFLIIPVYMRHRVTSAYELLEERLGVGIRLLGATMFLVLRLVWMTMLVYVAAKAMTVMMGVDFWVIQLDSWTVEAARFVNAAKQSELPGIMSWQNSEIRIAAIPIVVVAAGVVSLIYTSLGGLRAVVITDFLQTVLLFSGALLVLITVTYNFGGFGWFPTTWQETWDTQPIFPTSLKTRVTVVGTILTIFTWYTATLAGDQTSVQRFMATKDAATARRAVGTQLCVGFVVQLTLFAVGFALLSSYFSFRDTFPTDLDINKNADDLFPHFISFHLPVGVSGLVAAAMFAAAMSSIDSGVNSITAVVMTDFMERFGWKPKTEKGHLRTAQLIAVAVGVIVVTCSSFVKYIEGNITAVTSKTVNLLTTPIFALFFFALFVKFARPLGVWIGAICGTAVAVTIAFSGPIVYFLHVQFDIDPATFGAELIENTDESTGRKWKTAEDPISFQWIGPISLLVNICVGSLVSWLLPQNAVEAARSEPETK